MSTCSYSGVAEPWKSCCLQQVGQDYFSRPPAREVRSEIAYMHVGGGSACFLTTFAGFFSNCFLVLFFSIQSRFRHYHLAMMIQSLGGDPAVLTRSCMLRFLLLYDATIGFLSAAMKSYKLGYAFIRLLFQYLFNRLQVQRRVYFVFLHTDLTLHSVSTTLPS